MMEFIAANLDQAFTETGSLAIVSDDEKLLKTLDGKVNGQLEKLRAEAEEEEGWLELNAPSGLPAKTLYVVKGGEDMRKLGGELAARVKGEVTIFGADAEFAFGFALRNYKFEKYQKDPKTRAEPRFHVDDVKAFTEAFAPYFARVEGVHLARDLVNEPANILTTTEFANRIEFLSELGVEVEILEEKELEKIGLRALLGVGQGSENPSKVAIMRWNHGKGEPLALVGKGVIFDTGGISLKPASGMEEMIIDMGGAAAVVGTMHAIAARKAKANVVGIVGLVENMPDAKAQRPGDIVKSFKGDTIEIINTDAEGRLVLADILWYVQERFEPKAVIDLATLTGAVIVALGTKIAGIFGNDEEFVSELLAAAKTQGEKAWAMPVEKAYRKQLKSKHADIGNSGGREAGSITAAVFLENFIKEGMPWIHMDIAGVVSQKSANAFSIGGATGYGVLTLDQLIADRFES